MKPRDFVISQNSGSRNCVYTVIPVINDKILDLPFHMQRLQQSFPGIGIKERDEVSDIIADSCLKSFQNVDVSNGLLTVCLGLKSLNHNTEVNDKKNNHKDDKTSSYQGDISNYNDSSMFESDSLLYPMNADFLSINSLKLIVDVKEYTRMNPRIKASSWPLERLPLETENTPASETIMYRCFDRSDINLESNDFSATNTNEGLIIKDRLFLSEGLTSNFFVCENDCLVTASEEVALSGSMSRLVVATAESLGIKIERKMPELSFSQPSNWDGVFLTSATKPIRVVEKVIGPEGKILFDSVTLKECEMITVIRKKLDSVLRDQENRFVKTILPYSLWTSSITTSTTPKEMREIFKMNLI